MKFNRQKALKALNERLKKPDSEQERQLEEPLIVSSEVVKSSSKTNLIESTTEISSSQQIEANDNQS